MIGIAIIKDNYPLYFDAANEFGLAMAGLNYPGSAHYYSLKNDKDNIAPFEFIPWVLGQAKTLIEAKKLLARINLVDIIFSAKMPLSPLHWLIADKSGEAITVEADKDGTHVYQNPVGVLTNNPPFAQQLFNLNNYQDLSRRMPANNFSEKIDFNSYSRGLETRNLPGGMDSESRFVRGVFSKFNAPQNSTEYDCVNDLFHIMQSVSQTKGLDEVAPGKFEYTIYTSAFNLDMLQYYYSTYDNQQIGHLDFHKCDLQGNELQNFAMSHGSFAEQN